jgi:predicted HicB family RNase H-like nuclease
MSNLLSYKNYNGTVEYSKDDGCLFGKVVRIKSLLSYEGNSIQELENNFQAVIDEYITDCEERGQLTEQSVR